MPINVGDLELVLEVNSKGIDKASKQLTKLRGELERSAKAAERLRNATAKSLSAMQSSTREVIKGEKAVARVRDKSAQEERRRRQIQLTSAKMTGRLYIKQADDAARAIQRQRNALASVGDQYRNLRQQLQRTNANGREINTLDRAFQRYQQTLKRGALSTEEFNSTQRKFRTVLGTVRRNAKESTGELSAFQRNMRELTSASVLAVGPLSQIGARVQALGSIASRTTILMTALVGAAVGVTVAIGALGYGTVATMREYERFQAILASTSGSLVQARAELNYVLNTSERLGVNFRSLALEYSKLRAAAESSNIPFAQSREIFEGFATASAALRLTAEQTGGVFRALQQIISKGNVQAEELRGQLGERLPGAFGLAAKALGVTTKKLNDMLEAGEVAASELLPKMSKLLKETFDESAARNVDSIEGSLNNLSNAMFKFFVEFDKVTGLSKIFVDAVQGITAGIKALTGSLQGLYSVLSTVTAALLGGLAGKVAQIALSSIWGMVQGIRALKIALSSLIALRISTFFTALAASANPLGAMLTALGALAGVFYSIESASDTAKNAIEGSKSLLEDFNRTMETSKVLGVQMGKVWEENLATQIDVVSAQLQTAERRQKQLAAQFQSSGTTSTGAGGIPDIEGGAVARDLYEEQTKQVKALRAEHEKLVTALEKAKDRRKELNDATENGLSETTDSMDALLKKYKELEESLHMQLFLIGNNTDLAKLHYRVALGDLQALNDEQKMYLLNLQREISQRREAFELQEEVKEQLADMRKRLQLVGAETNAEKMLWEVQKGKFADVSEATKKQLVAQARALDLTLKRKEAEEELERAGKDAAGAITDGISDMVIEFKSLNDVLADVLKNIARIVLEKSVLEPAADFGGKYLEKMFIGMGAESVSGGAGAGASSGGSIPSPFPSAKGNAFYRGQLQRFASGGVVSSPTMFSFGNGKRGLMGEAGSEAILPLARSGGVLGVQAVGAGGGSVVVNIYDQRGKGEKVETRESRDGNGRRQLDIYIRDQVRNGFRSGEFDGDMRRNYGVTRRSRA